MLHEAAFDYPEQRPRPPGGPLLKRAAPPLSTAERLRMLEQAMQALAQEPGLSPPLRARGIAPLAAAYQRLRDQAKAQ